MASNQPNPKRNEGGQTGSTKGDKSGAGSKGTSSGGTPGGKLPNDKSPQSGSSSTAGGGKK